MLFFNYEELLGIGVKAEDLFKVGSEFVKFCENVFGIFYGEEVSNKFLQRLMSLRKKDRKELFSKWRQLEKWIAFGSSPHTGLISAPLAIINIFLLLDYLGIKHVSLPKYLKKVNLKFLRYTKKDLIKFL